MATKTIKINNKLWVNSYPIVIPQKVDVKAIEASDSSHQYLIFDRSGSMYGYLDRVMDEVTKYVDALPDGSSVSLGYFSSTGEYNLSVPYTLKKEIDGVKKTINSYRDALGLTNFIQILEKVNSTSAKSKEKSSLFFFTDGCHNSGGSKKDIENALLAWKEYSNITTFVGYGYIDRDMMTWMAKTTGGSFVHLDSFANFGMLLSEFGSAVEDCSPSIEVDVPVNVDMISFNSRTIVQYAPTNNKIKYKVSKKDYRGLFFITDYKLDDATEITELDTTLEKGIRALAYIASQKNDVPTALELLSYLGDKYLIRLLYNSISPDEFAVAESKLRKSTYSPADRYIEGKVSNYLPSPDAFCILDALNILSNDNTVKMYINDDDFEYEKISKKTVQLDGPYPKFESDNGVYLNNIVYNKERLNVSVSTSTKATVDLLSDKFVKNPGTKAELDSLNLPQDYTVSLYRTYTIISDGRLQTKKLVLSDLSKDSIQQLASVITKRSDGKYLLDLSQLPIINQTYSQVTSAKTLAENIWNEKKLTDAISVFNHLKKVEMDLQGKVSTKDVGLTDEQVKYLFEHFYIKNNSYNPPLQVLTGNDEFEAYSFSIDIKGFSKASAKDVIAKIDSKKKTTPRELLIEQTYVNRLDGYKASKMVRILTLLEYYDAQLSKLNSALNNVRKQVQLSKFAIILASKGKMDEFTSRENMQLTLSVPTFDDTTLDVLFDFKIEKIKVIL